MTGAGSPARRFGSRTRPRAELIKLDPADVLTTEETARLLAPLIKPLPDFDEEVLGYQQPVVAALTPPKAPPANPTLL